MTSASPRPEHPKQSVIDVGVDLTAGDMTVVERPSSERLVEVCNDVFLLGSGMSLKPASDLRQFCENLLLLRFDQECALVPAKVEPEEVEPVVDVDDASLFF